MINFAPFINLLLNKNNKKVTKRQLTPQDKKEIKKINEMGMFEAMDYLAKKDTGAGFQGDSSGDGLSGFRG